MQTMDMKSYNMEGIDSLIHNVKFEQNDTSSFRQTKLRCIKNKQGGWKKVGQIISYFWMM